MPKKSLQETFNEKVLKPAKVMFIDPFVDIAKKVRNLKKGDLKAFFNKVAHLKMSDVKAAWRKAWPVIKDTLHDLSNLRDIKGTAKEIGIFLTLNLFPYPGPSVPYILYRVGKYKLKQQAAANDNKPADAAPANDVSDTPKAPGDTPPVLPETPGNVIIRRRNPSP